VIYGGTSVPLLNMTKTEFVVYAMYGARLHITKEIPLRRLHVLQNNGEIGMVLNNVELLKKEKGIYLKGLVGFNVVMAGPIDKIMGEKLYVGNRYFVPRSITNEEMLDEVA
jgi:hypothetical protein